MGLMGRELDFSLGLLLGQDGFQFGSAVLVRFLVGFRYGLYRS